MILSIFILNGELVTISNDQDALKIKIKVFFSHFLSLRWLILISYLLISGLPLMFYYSTFSNTLDKHFIDERKKELFRQANITADHISVSNYLTDESKKTLFDFDIQQNGKQGMYRIIVVDSKGIVVNDSNKTEEGKTLTIPEIVEALEGNNIATLQPNKIMYVAAPVTDYSITATIGAVLISASVEDINILLDDVKNQLFILTILTCSIIGILAFFVSQIIIDPIKSLLSAIQKMSNGYLSERIKITGHNEISELAIAFNAMSDRLEKVDTSRQEFVSNVSHELKTPLSSMKVLSESILFQDNVPAEMYKEFLHDINCEIDRMTAIIVDLLNLVRLDQREVPITLKPSNIKVLIEGIVKRLSPFAVKKNIELTIIEENGTVVDCDEMKLSLAISNLVENAIKYTPENGHVKITVASDHQHAFIKVKDTGIGIAEEEQKKIFERFYRIDKTRDRETGGTGLGLSITHSTVLLHKGSIKVTSRENEGTTFLVRIPLHQN